MWNQCISAVITLSAFLSGDYNRSQVTKCFLSSSLSNGYCENVMSNNNICDYFLGIRKGKIYIENNFISPSEVQTLKKDIAQLKHAGKFHPSGLSNRILNDENVFGETDRLTCTITPDLWKGDPQYSLIRSLIEDKLEDLKNNLERELSPERLHKGRIKKSNDGSLVKNGELPKDFELQLAEMYYSLSPIGSNLPRHQDERHEDTKGDKGWINDTRRSISWLIYLNDDWGENANDGSRKPSGRGGELRAFCRNCCSDVNIRCGTNEGDLQVGWLPIRKTGESAGDSIEFEPIFLDSWVKTPIDEKDDKNDEYERVKWRPLSALYRMKRNYSTEIDYHKDANDEDDDRTIYNGDSVPQKEYLSKPFGPDSPTWPSDIDLEPAEFVKALALQLCNPDFQERFLGTEDIGDHGIDIVDFMPSAGTLVLFDSVTVPHEVLEVKDGERLAIAGWFHEEQQSFPDWYGT